jgi:hypothetical protein
MARWIRIMLVPVVSLAVAGFLIWYGTGMITRPAVGTPSWLGWAILGVGVIKGTFWPFVVGWLIHQRSRVMVHR